MHMADALLSPTVAGVMWAGTAGLLAWSARRVRRHSDDRIVPLMGVLGAFVFAAQMINFTIPGTGSSGHIGGGMLLAILLGPAPAFLVIASVLTVQALFFADGGLLALGANVFNLGFFPCLIAWPLLWRPLMRGATGMRRLTPATVLATVVGLQLGALGVVFETVGSGLTDLPTWQFLALMQPIHLAIGVVEGLATAAVVHFLWRARPDLVPADLSSAADTPPPRRLRPVLLALTGAALLLGGIVSWFASADPDGLEWSVAAVGKTDATTAPAPALHARLAHWQQRLAWLPDYDFAPARDAVAPPHEPTPQWPAVSAGRSTAGVLGGVMTLTLIAALGLALRRWQRRRAQA